jgi:hypothetical protein
MVGKVLVSAFISGLVSGLESNGYIAARIAIIATPNPLP